MLMGTTPNFANHAWGCDGEGSLQVHTRQVSQFGKKKFEKKFGGYMKYVLPLVGGWVCLY
jgi:hypothetical protein